MPVKTKTPEKIFPAYPVFDMDFTLALADVATEFLREVAVQNNLPENHFTKKLEYYISNNQPVHEAMASGKPLPKIKPWLKKELNQYPDFYPGWEIERVFKDMIPNLASGQFKLSLGKGQPKKPITRKTLVDFARQRVPLVPGTRRFFRELNASRFVNMSDCFIATANLKPFAEGIAAKINAGTGPGPKILREHIFGLDFLTDAHGKIYGISNYHDNEKIKTMKKIERIIFKKIKKKPYPALWPKHGNPTAHMIYIGDGITDAKAMKYVSSGGKGPGQGLSIQVNPDARLIKSGSVEFAVVSPSMRYLWRKLVRPYILHGGGEEAKKHLARRILGNPFARKASRGYHSSLLHRYEVFLGPHLSSTSHERLGRIAAWRRDYNLAPKAKRAKLFGQRFLIDGPKRGIKKVTGKLPRKRPK